MSCDDLSYSSSAQLIMKNVAILRELASQLKKESKHSEACLSSLNSLLLLANKDVSSIHHCVNSLLTISKKLVHTSLQLVPEDDVNFKSLKSETDNLLRDLKGIQHQGIANNEDEHIEAKLKHKIRENPSCKSFISDEKYPEHCSKESLLDMNGIGVLPTVHEDVFADFHRPSRTMSCSSLKSLRKVKMYLQKVSDSGNDNSDNDKLETTDSNINPANTHTKNLVHRT